MAPPKFALIRPLASEVKKTVGVEDLYVVSNYELTAFVPKNSKSFSTSQIYGWKKVDDRGVTKIVKCKIILLQDSQKAIEDEIRKGKLPRVEPSRFESSIQHTEDFILYELVQESKKVKSKEERRIADWLSSC